jgi:medium-chain acyl-[acyl-carrier-protein] hydrolase
MYRRWLPGHELNPDAAFRLFCLPYAGGGASIYHQWREVAPSHIDVCALELPGRGSRMREDPFMRLTPLVRDLANSLDGAFDRPFALFGHSMGGLIAFELARTLRKRGSRPPAHLFISATRAPGTPSTQPLVHSASAEDVKKYLRVLNGTPQVILEDDDLMALMLPMLRADFSVLETYEYRDEPPLAIPITVFGGTADRLVPPSALAGWRRQSARCPRTQLFPGDHFFVQTAAFEIVAHIARTLDLQSAADQALI